MAMPPQLARARRPKRYQPRPLFETLPSLDARALARRKLFPGNWFERISYPFLVPGMVIAIARCNIEVTHRSGVQQVIPVYWQRITGATNSQRPMFICNCCKRRAFKLCSLQGAFRCKRCAVKLGAIYACQQRSAKGRPALQAARLRHFLGGWSGTPAKPPLMHKQTYARLIGRLRQLETKNFRTQQFNNKADHRISRPASMYRTQIAHVARQ
jgi:hypothetical protein